MRNYPMLENYGMNTKICHNFGGIKLILIKIMVLLSDNIKYKNILTKWR